MPGRFPRTLPRNEPATANGATEGTEITENGRTSNGSVPALPLPRRGEGIGVGGRKKGESVIERQREIKRRRKRREERLKGRKKAAIAAAAKKPAKK
jgi:hypothetical protein